MVKSRKKISNQVRALTLRTRGRSPSKVMAELTLYLRGALNYCACGIPNVEVRALDGWLSRRMRLYDWKSKRPIGAR